ncbi:hypothetical protein [Hyalangium minutum]|uniref:Uncharacterized protein n=1 Tax=Hyalangium minutum TaxID=394096 RepID=A0A085W8B6_9BACT|nr:hypothetical protein [Hyalangium minutum]KFE63929.1 hypothetical protein DB31_2341 [Hyalangium minutum]
MKIDSPKFAPVPRVASRPASAPASAAASNTGIVPTTKRPSDGFETASARPSTAATGNTGITGAGTASVSAKPSSTDLDFELDPSLEPYRDVFAKLGTRISKLPTEEERTKAIDVTALRLSESLQQDYGKVKEGLTNAVAAASRGPSSSRDPQCCFRMDRLLDFSSNVKQVGDKLKNLGLDLAKDVSLRSKGQILKAAQPQLDQLNLKGRDMQIAQRYVVGLVHEARARDSGSTGGEGRLPRLPNDRFQLRPRQ